VAALAAYVPASVAVVALLVLIGSALSRAPSWGRPAAVALTLVALALHTHGALPLRVVGMSYAAFRLIHVFIEEGRGLPRPGALSLLEYVLFPPSFLSGPIARYPEFKRGAALEGLDLDQAFWAARRLLFGLAKKVYLVEPLRATAEAAFLSTGLLSPLDAWQGLFAYSLFIYIDFSAYCDIALGVARLFGFALPENFDWPYLAPSIAEFWRRWHMTLTSWLRDYVYLPLSARLAHVDALRRRPLAIGAVATIVTMLACGLWHGDTASFALWGLGHGALLAGHLAVLGALPARRRKALAASRAYIWSGTLATFVAVSVLWVLFRLPPAEAGAYYARLLGR
jgi:alginate O-acetyltransferase complex protein AlgI